MSTGPLHLRTGAAQRWFPGRRRRRDLRRLLFALGPPLVAAGVGGLGSRNAPTTYALLRKPGWAPPASVFGPVWTTLYVGIGVAGWHLYPRTGWPVRSLHLGQLALNGAWPLVFFTQRNRLAAVGVIVGLDAAVAAEVLALRRTDPVAAALLAPYLTWSLFAAALNTAVRYPASSSTAHIDRPVAMWHPV